MLFVRAGILPDSPDNAGVGETAAQDATERDPDLFVRGIRLSVENGLCREDYAAETESALGSAFVDEGLLERVRLLRCAKTFEGSDLVLRSNRAHRHDARPDHLAAQNDRAGAALRQSAAESWASEAQVIRKNE
jgi:hypothetical protein